MTSNRRRFIAGAGAVAGAAIAGAPAIVTGQQPAKWKMQTLWSAAEITYKAFEDLCGRIRQSHQRPPGDPAVRGRRGDRRVRDARRGAGRRAAGASRPRPVYFTGKDARLRRCIGDLNFGYQHPWQADAWFYYKGGLEMLREALRASYNAYCVGVTWWGVESIVSKKPIRNMADFKGVKFRSPQGISAEILTKLGASIVVLPGGEVFSALDKGVVDAADWATISMNQRMGFHEVAKYPTKCYHSMPCQDFTVNVAAWKALPDDIKEIVNRRVREWTWDQVQRVAVDDVRVLKELRARASSMTTWDGRGDGQGARRWRTKTWEDWSKKTPLAKQAYDSQIAWLKDLGVRCMSRTPASPTAKRARGALRRRRPLPPVAAASATRSTDSTTWIGRVWGAAIAARDGRRHLRGGGARRRSARRPSGRTRPRSTCRRSPTCSAAATPCCTGGTSAST